MAVSESVVVAIRSYGRQKETKRKLGYIQALLNSYILFLSFGKKCHFLHKMTLENPTFS